MAHECPDCFQMCYCDMDDCFFDNPVNCRHDCGPEWDEEDDGFEDWRDETQEAPSHG